MYEGREESNDSYQKAGNDRKGSSPAFFILVSYYQIRIFGGKYGSIVRCQRNGKQRVFP